MALSVQVLQEFYVQATRPTREDRLTHAQARDLVESFTRFEVQPITVEVLRAAMATQDRFGVSHWDATILEAARTLGCVVVLSEDLQHGGDYDGVVVEDPSADRAGVAASPAGTRRSTRAPDEARGKGAGS